MYHLQAAFTLDMSNVGVQLKQGCTVSTWLHVELDRGVRLKMLLFTAIRFL